MSHPKVRPRIRRTGWVTLGLFLITASAALGLSLIRKLGVAPTLLSILVGGGAPAGLYLAWATYRDSGDLDSDALNLSAVADQLASAIADQWQTEAAERRLNDPYPMPVRWKAADDALADSWESLRTLASTGAGWASSATTWASGPKELAGGDNQLADVLERVPTRRLVVLGEPGTGKTMLMIRLVLDLLSRRERGGTVPVLVSVASWDPTAEDLHSWLAAALMTAYPGLSAPAPQGCAGNTRMEALLKASLIMPILDGLDEISDAVRSYAVSKINDALRPGEHLVVTSRTAAYLQAVQPAAGMGATLRAAVVELHPLEASEVAEYLRRSAAGAFAAARWDSVAMALRNPGPLAETLTVPLMAGLARIIYNPRPGEQIGLLPEPAELCSFTSRSAIEGHLLDALIPAVYRTGPARARWTPGRATRWFGFLARHLEYRIRNPDLNWWQLGRAGNATVIGGLTIGIAAGISVILTLLFSAVFAAVFLKEPVGLPSLSLYYTWDIKTASSSEGITVDPIGISSIMSALKLTLVAALAASLIGTLAIVGSGELPGHVQFSGTWTFRGEGLGQRVIRLAYGAASAVIVGFAISSTLGWGEWHTGSLSYDLIAVFAVAIVAAVGAGNTRFRKGYSTAIVAGMIIGFPYWALVDAYFGWAVGLPAGLIAGLTSAVVDNVNRRPTYRLRWRPVRAIVIGVLIGASVGFLVYWSTNSEVANWITNPQVTIIVLGLVAGAAGAILVGAEPVSSNSINAVTPNTMLIRDRRITLFFALMALIIGGLAASMIGVMLFVVWGFGYSFALAFGLSFGFGLGTSIAIFLGLASNGFGSAWPRWVIAREICVLRRHAPQRLMTFLADGREKGVLRQVGTAYQFRHIELQRRLANRNGKEIGK